MDKLDELRVSHNWTLSNADLYTLCALEAMEVGADATPCE